ncbi:MAG TPA: nuclear transport factor 2 family protein [Hanamia sp.]|nr:nuclear transport factor 2 family protein [Hanamia sp.]
MQNNNQQVIEQMYSDFAAGDIPAVLSLFDKDVVWIRAGAPFIPFSGTCTGIEEVMKMFEIQHATLNMKSFVPQKFCTNEDSIIVIGHDEAEVKPTGKNYAADWVQAFTLKDGKIINVQVFMDTKVIADAFEK